MIIHDLRQIWQKRGNDFVFRKNLIWIFITYFFILFSYPLARSASSALFFEQYTSQDIPLATFLTVMVLTSVVYLTNWIQKYTGVHHLLGLISVGTAVLFFLGGEFASSSKYWAMFFFITKEIYIVLLIHLVLAFCNGYLHLNEVKAFYGPLGAMGSLGGILGGQLTSLLAQSYGTQYVVYAGAVTTLISAAVFYLTFNVHLVEKNKIYETTPIKAISDVKKYVYLIAILTALSQFVIFVADLQFNIVFEQEIAAKDERTATLGQLYSLVNFFSLLIQVVVIPFVMLRFKTKTLHYSVPLLFLLLVIIGPAMGIGGLYVLGGVFISMKALDYSLLSIIKEVLYHPLTNLQKYGAKYITDIYVYRLAKGFFALALQAWTTKTLFHLNILQAFFLAIWTLTVYFIFEEQKKNQFKVD